MKKLTRAQHRDTPIARTELFPRSELPTKWPKVVIWTKFATMRKKKHSIFAPTTQNNRRLFWPKHVLRKVSALERMKDEWEANETLYKTKRVFWTRNRLGKSSICEGAVHPGREPAFFLFPESSWYNFEFKLALARRGVTSFRTLYSTRPMQNINSAGIKIQP